MRYGMAIIAAVLILGTTEQCEAARFTAEFYDRLFPVSTEKYEELFNAKDAMTQTWNRMSTVDYYVIRKRLGPDAAENVRNLQMKYDRYISAVRRAVYEAEHGTLSEKEEQRAIRSVALGKRAFAQFVDILTHFEGAVALR